ncbi:MAG: DEAD/DEAH box helicase family protein [bacterium]|nr:DEAD/DEAH box helicase family protein [bacterium]
MLYEDFDAKKRMDGDAVFKNRVPDFVATNLSPAAPLREYQKEAFGRLVFYLSEYKSKQLPVHLLFNMATGSGKTLVMAGAMIHLYTLGYRNFLFFVNSTNIIEKTKDNFLNSRSPKYQFAEKIVIGGKTVSIRSVDNFSAFDPDGINIFFTTIQGLHTRIHEPKESTLTLEDFDGREFVLLSDEAHHINALTRAKLSKDEAIEKMTWEGTVRKVMAKNTRNVLLEFTATIDTQNPDIAEKYADKIIYRYDLAEFRSDGFSKDIKVAGIDFPPMARALGAVLLSQYRRKVAERNGLQLKPVVLMKSRGIKESQEFEAQFHKVIQHLKVSDILKLKTRGSNAHAQAFAYFTANDIALGNLVREIKDDFAPEKCVSVNSKDDSDAKQLLVNSLEAKTNPIRVVFAVDKLNEGWDVLNLFDIVRLYETRQSGGRAISPVTMAEAQLIGRGARYWPFTLSKNGEDRFVRKFDRELTNEMRIVEQLYYHTKHDSRYIAEITSALVKTGALAKPENVRPYTVKVKEEIKQTKFWKEGQIFLNDKRETGRRHIRGIADIPCIPERFVFSLRKGGGEEVTPFEKGGAGRVRETVTKDITPLDASVWREALYRLPFYRFDSLVRFFPHCSSVHEFISSKKYLGGVTVAVQGEATDVFTISRNDMLDAALSALQDFERLVLANTSEFEGTKEFVAHPIQKIVREEKYGEIVVSDSGDQEFGVAMSIARDASLRLDLGAKDWYVYDENYGTKEEKQFVHFLHDVMTDLKQRYEEVRLLRNEGLKLYRFADGRAVEPDFILFLRERDAKSATVYQLFVEPKGEHLRAGDQWKEDFLKEIAGQGKVVTLFENVEYKIVGLPFYTHDNNTVFEDAFEKYR